MPIERLFTSAETGPYDLSTFIPRMGKAADGSSLTFNVPSDWRAEAAQVFATALYPSVPAVQQPIEENTLPSWLWQRKRHDKRTVSEASAHQVFSRVAGAAVYGAWKKGLIRDETEASSFYDELRFMMARRVIAMEPQQLRQLGVNWSYGCSFSPLNKPVGTHNTRFEHSEVMERSLISSFSIQNDSIDALLGGKNDALRTRLDAFATGKIPLSLLNLTFTDTAAEWGTSPSQDVGPSLMINLMSFRRANGTFDVALFQHAVKLSVFLLELHYDQLASTIDPTRSLAIGYSNLAALLMSMAIPYNSDAGRANAAAISAIMTAEAVATSAQLAGSLGPCLSFFTQRDIRLRALRNHRRAAYGEHNDYERLSILPEPLDIEAGADLVLVATARRRWDEALELVQQHGLRHLQLTALFAAPVFAPLMPCSAQGAEPETTLIRQRMFASDLYQREIHPSVPLALEKLGCDPADIKAIVDYAVGYNTLVGAPGVNHDLLTERGFDADAIARVEEYLPRINNIRHAFTPWIIGEDFCQNNLGVTVEQCTNPRFDLLQHLGFSSEDIAAANAFCCGHDLVSGSSELPAQAANVFDTDGVFASIRMAAAVQSFMMGDVGLVLSVPEDMTNKEREEYILAAWRHGMKSVSLYFEGFAPLEQPAEEASVQPAEEKRTSNLPTRQITPKLMRKQALAHITSSRPAKPKATSRTVSLKGSGTKPQTGASKKSE